MGDIGRLGEFNETEWHGAEQDIGFYETRWILKFSFTHHLINRDFFKFCLDELE